jgi:hypothetical protein
VVRLLTRRHDIAAYVAGARTGNATLADPRVTCWTPICVARNDSGFLRADRTRHQPEPMADRTAASAAIG